MIECVFLFFGFVCGVIYADNRRAEKNALTLAEAEEKVAKDYQMQKNLNASLKQDVKFLREKIEKMKTHQ